MSEMPESFQEAPRESSAQTGATATAKVRDDRRVRWLVAAALLFVASTFLALRQPPWSDPYNSPRTFSVEWWLHPIESNAERRLPQVSSEINGVWMSEDQQRMWAVGDRGLVLRSDDRGERWRQLEIGGALRSDEISSRPFWSWPEGESASRLPNSLFEAMRVAWQDDSRFEPLAELPPLDLHSIWFRDELHGWVGGSDGFLMRTTDGGERWEGRRLPEFASPSKVLTLYFPRPDLGCMILTAGEGDSAPMILAVTHDEGTSWRLLAQTDFDLFIVREDACLAVDDGQLLVVNAATNSPDDLERRTLPESRLRNLAERDRIKPSHSQNGAVLAAAGTHLRLSEDAGASWRSASLDPEAGHHSLHFFDRQRGIAATQYVEGGSHIRSTDDGGTSWRPIIETPGGPARLRFIDSSRGWAASLDQALVSDDGGKTWEDADDPTDMSSFLSSEVYQADRHPDGVSAFLLTEGVAFVNEQAGYVWLPPDVPYDRQGISRLHRGDATDSLELEVLANERLYELQFRQTDGDIRSQLIDDRSRPGARSLDRVEDRLWVGGWNGLYIVGDDADEQITDRPVLAFSFLDRQTGWIAEPGGGLLFTEDGGITWTDLTPYRIYPAPWYWLACFVSLLLLTPAFRRPPTQEVHRSVAEMAVSDRPIEAGDPDPLDFGQVALGLSRFLRNSATQPPLTLAVTGKWGTGKSSLMNLLRADLADYGFRPVWFNAWHHQKEEQLLAALLVNIRRQAIPSLLSPEGWAFRGRLLKRRMRRWRLLTLLLTLGFGLLTGWVATSTKGAGLMTRVWETLEKLNPAAWLAPNGEAVEPGMAAFLVAAAAVLFTVGRGLRAFGVDPGTLVAGLSSRASRRDARAQAGFRHRFAREFEDVTRALRPRTLTLLIDDLDRCRPQNVLDVLEAVNFLVSSGRCYVVLGIDREMVERFVGYGFREVADEILDRDETPAEEGDDEAAARARRAAFARQYLEKLINIEVAVPRVEEAAGRHLVRPPEPKAERPGRWQRLADWFRSLPGRWWALPAVLAVTLIAGLWLGSWFGKEPAPVVAETPPEEAVTVEPQAEPEVPDEATVLGEETAAPETPDEEQIATGPPARLIPGEEGDRHRSWFWLAVVVLLGGATIWVLTTLPQVEVHDSPEFVEALDAWFPLLHAETPTPRSIKRFLNRVRCYAMRQRPAEPPRTRWGAVGDWFRRLVGKPQKEKGDLPEDSGQIPERALVALAAVEHVYPHLLRDPDFWMDPWDTNLADPDDHPRTFRHIVKSNLPPIFIYRQAFERLSRGIETH